MKISQKIKEKRDAIWKSVGSHGHSDGTAIGTEQEMYWMAQQAARDGILLSYSASPETYKNGKECYYYYWAMSIDAEKQRVREFVDTRSLLSTKEVSRLMPAIDTTDEDELRVLKNLRRVRGLIVARNRRRTKRLREQAEPIEDEQPEAENEQQEEPSEETVKALEVARVLCKIFEKNELLEKRVETQEKIIKNQDEMIACYKQMMTSYKTIIEERNAVIDKLQRELETLKGKG